MAYNFELDTAINAVVKASRLCRDVQNSLMSKVLNAIANPKARRKEPNR